jgi:hypothetical protein
VDQKVVSNKDIRVNKVAKAKVQVTPARSERCCDVLILPAAAVDLLNTTNINIFLQHLRKNLSIFLKAIFSLFVSTARPDCSTSRELPFSFPMADCYDMLGKVGQGAFGVVWRARVKATGAIVAIKVKTGR